ncbi:hypothetical protein MMYC01_210017 [Madurella mycetomatis]|uniref:Uncharacterized protein n=1 Tax=Madurella mycetomatis TaxID=100816 RepID=A0A175VQY8_9PEZI|nr:hypothetical protein MMYC01_210017 [Madurella mycetomatis]
MQLKLLLVGLVAVAAAMPSPATVDNAQGETESDISARADYRKWNASGGCKTDWGGRCLNKCKSEAKSKGYTCDKVASNIWKEECWLGWSGLAMQIRLYEFLKSWRETGLNIPRPPA